MRDSSHPDQPQRPEIQDVTRTAPVFLYSFGYLHEDGIPQAVTDHNPHLILDVRTLWRDPHHDPAMRQLTGLDNEIRVRVLNQPGAVEYLEAQAAAIGYLAHHNTQPIRVAIGCAGGRHRSVVAVNKLAQLLGFWEDIPAEVRHLHLHLPVVERAQGGER